MNCEAEEGHERSTYTTPDETVRRSMIVGLLIPLWPPLALVTFTLVGGLADGLGLIDITRFPSTDAEIFRATWTDIRVVYGSIILFGPKALQAIYRSSRRGRNISPTNVS